MASPCIGRARHWRIAWGSVGLRIPVCAYCGSPNPRPLTRWEWEDLAEWMKTGANVGEYVRLAFAARALALTPSADLPACRDEDPAQPAVLAACYPDPPEYQYPEETDNADR